MVPAPEWGSTASTATIFSITHSAKPAASRAVSPLWRKVATAVSSWVVTGGCSRLVPGRLVPVLSDKINFRVNALVYDRSSKLYIGTQQELFVYDTLADKLEQTTIRRDVLLSDNEVTALAFFGAATAFGWPPITICITSALPTIAGIISRPVDADGVIRSIIDLGDRVFLGCYRSGLAIFDIATATFPRAPMIGSNLVTALGIDPVDPRAIYVATDGEGVFRYKLGEVTGIPENDRLRSKSVYSMLVDERGLMW